MKNKKIKLSIIAFTITIIIVASGVLLFRYYRMPVYVSDFNCKSVEIQKLSADDKIVQEYSITNNNDEKEKFIDAYNSCLYATFIKDEPETQTTESKKSKIKILFSTDKGKIELFPHSNGSKSYGAAQSRWSEEFKSKKNNGKVYLFSSKFDDENILSYDYLNKLLTEKGKSK